jgi:phospho-N-acetylmuramoyl-pentapeptide-transferase
MTVFALDNLLGVDDPFNFNILLFCVCLLGYLWYNATPSKLLMGDAGSRAMGIFIAIAVLKMGSPFLYLLVAAVLIVDGGLGLIKVSLLRFLKIHILTNVTTPLHDHVRKKLGWSNAQVVFRFAIIQLVISTATVYLIMI